MPPLFSVNVDPVKERLNVEYLVKEPLAICLTELGILGQRVARQEAPRDIGSLGGSIGLEVQPLFARVYTELGYAPVMEYGRAAGAKMPPPQALAGWAQRHGFAGNLFVLARSIARRGIKGRFFFRKAQVAVEAAIPQKLNEMSARIEANWSKA